jgi:Holliday junction DNA helicase RuvA
MYDFIKGRITELTPTYVVLENNGIGYLVNISLHTYSALYSKTDAHIYLYQVIREDAHIFYGFFDKTEREIFKLLISISGIGANTARMILSSLNPGEIVSAISSGNVSLLKNIKGIGEKTAQRIIVELKDKVVKLYKTDEIFNSKDNTIKDEALSALVMLGFNKNIVMKVLDKVMITDKSLTVEELIKKALKIL